jgi:NTE family protein
MLPMRSTNRGSGWLRRAVARLREFARAKPISEAESVLEPPRRPRVGLALGGGFARGISHLGVLRVFEEEHIPIDYLAGTSAGALVAISYASRHSIPEIAEQARVMRFKTFGGWQLSWMGLASNQKLERYPHKFLGLDTFEELRIPVVIAATDLQTGESVYFTHGPLGPALRASCAYPGMFVPVEFEGRILVDGFLTAPVPVEALRRMGAEVIIAVHLEAANDRRPTSVADVIGLSFAILQRHTDPQWRRMADVIIEPQVSDFLWDDFSKTPELIAAGEAATRAALPKIRAALEPKPRQVVFSSAPGRK